jgi:nucleotide-binding universal stress UspA family protein
MYIPPDRNTCLAFGPLVTKIFEKPFKQSPMKTNVVVLTTSTFSRAALIKTMLKDENIECFLSNVNLIQPNVSFGVNIRVYEKDLTRAMKVLREIEKRHGKDLIRRGKKPMRVRRLLVPVDFSSYSLNAAKFAMQLAGTLKAEIRLFHAFYNPVIDTMSFPDAFTYQANMAEVYREMNSDARKHMKEFLAKLTLEEVRNKTDVKVSKKLVAGTPGEEIISESEKYKPELILIGTRGSGENPNEPIGKVTSSILDHSRTPVLVIPEKSKFVGSQKNIQVLYATDFDETDEEAIKKLMAVISPFNFKIHCVHVSKNIRDQVTISRMKDLKSELKEIYHDLNLECELIRDDDKVDGLRKFVHQKNIDLIALTHHKRNILQKMFETSTAKRMIFESEKPVLIFQA